MYFGGDNFRVSFKWVVMIITKQRGSYTYTYTEYKSQNMLHTLALWGLVTNYGEGGLQNGKGGQVKFYPYKRGGGGSLKKVLAMLNGGDTKRFEVVLTWELEVLAIVMGGGGATSFHPLRLDYGG